MLGVFSALLSHAPGYGCDNNCCHTTKPHTTSQAYYHRVGPGTRSGLEIDVPTDNDEHVVWDAVFRDRVDQSTYSIHVGCGGCLDSDELAPEVSLSGYNKGHLEPFTQHRYYDLFPEATRTIAPEDVPVCAGPHPHFTVTLVAFDNASTIFWSAVIGKGEIFTAEEIISMPIYILRNHGWQWNERPWSLFFIVLTVCIVYVCASFIMVGDLRTLAVTWFDVWRISPRSVLYTIATLAYMSSLLESIYHVSFVAQSDIPIDEHTLFAMFLGIVVGFGHVMPLLVIWLIWYCMRYRSLTWRFDASSCTGIFSNLLSGGFWAHPYWWFFELCTGVSWLFLLGSGYFVGPSAIILASLTRLYYEVLTVGAKFVELSPPKDAPPDLSRRDSLTSLAQFSFAGLPLVSLKK